LQQRLVFTLEFEMTINKTKHMKKTKGDIMSDIVDTDLYLVMKCGDETSNSTRRV